MAKLNRERRLLERRQEKQARKDARKRAAAKPDRDAARDPARERRGLRRLIGRGPCCHGRPAGRNLLTEPRPEGPAMSTEPTAPDTIVLIHGFWVTPRSWEHWIAHYEARGYRVLAPAYPGLRGGGRGAQRRPLADRAGDGARDHRPPRVRHRRARLAADPDGPLRRRRVHADAARSRLRRGRRGDQLGARPRASPWCRSRRSRRRSRCSRTRPTATGPSASRTSSGTTRSPTPSARRSRARCTSATTSRPPGSIFWGSALANIHPGHDDT